MKTLNKLQELNTVWGQRPPAHRCGASWDRVRPRHGDCALVLLSFGVPDASVRLFSRRRSQAEPPSSHRMFRIQD